MMCDGAGWHDERALTVNVTLALLPPHSAQPREHRSAGRPECLNMVDLIIYLIHGSMKVI